MSYVSLEQWRTLVAVVEAGGYAQAAIRLHKTQSSITYTIQQIEDRLGVVIFQIEGRKANLTEAGRVLYRRAKALGEEAERIERTAGKLAQGREPVVSLAVESLFPIGLWLNLCLASQLCCGDMQPPIPTFADGGDGARAGTVPAAPMEESVAMAQIRRAWQYR